GVMERDLSSGEPTGVLLDMEALIEAAMPSLPYEELSAAVAEASGRFLRAGVTCVQDATYTNGRTTWELFERLIEDGALPLDVVLMEGVEHLGELPERGANGRLRRGPVKIMLFELGDDFTPGENELSLQVSVAHAAGRQVAVHAVGERAVSSAAEAIEAALAERPRVDHRHRIEHCGLLPDGLAARLADLGIVIVSQPSFLYERGERYRQLVPEERLRALYAFRTLRDAGVRLAAGSDAPVSPPQPLASVAAASERKTSDGEPLGLEQAVPAGEALRWWTAGAAHAAFLEGERGALRPGLRADLVLVPANGLHGPPEGLRRASVERCWREGAELSPAGGTWS
ncbi:MAG: amidohydrolase family protein, partial [Dehalococcoidia bacterium]|nr:amidohydrolase family protein [Dehalococcoidia bacterium]